MNHTVSFWSSAAIVAGGLLAAPAWAQTVTATDATQPASAAAVATPATAIATAAASASAPAASDSAGFSANIGLVSLYKFRGQDQYASPTERHARPALQGGLDYAFAKGFYIGNWNSLVRLYDVDGQRTNVEMDFYGGYKFSTGAVAWDVGVLRYHYPNAAKLGTTELYAGATYKEVTLKYAHTVSRHYFGIDGSRNTGYLNLAWNHPIKDGLTLQASVGHTFYPGTVRAAGVPDYTDYSVGVAWDVMPKTTLTAAYVGADKSSSYGTINKGKAIVGIKYAF